MVLMRLSYTIFAVPHNALGAEFTDDYHERTSIYGWKVVVWHGGSVILAMLVYWIVFPSTPDFDNGLLNEGRYLPLAGVGAIIIFVATVATTVGTRDQIPLLHSIIYCYDFFGQIRFLVFLSKFQRIMYSIHWYNNDHKTKYE